jgi:tetratricopeptide (TPR) repeat protein
VTLFPLIIHPRERGRLRRLARGKQVAKYKKKRARELQHDRFRDTTMSYLDRLGDLLEGRGRTILYALGGLIVASLLVILFVKWNNRKNDEARQALGRAINITTAAVTTSPLPGSTEMTFSTERERAEKAIAEFEKVAAKYGEPYKSESRYFIASNRLVIDRQKGISELTELANSGSGDVAALSKFALAQANESDGKLDDAARLYSELARLNSATVTSETANLRLAKVYEKQGKKKEAADLLFNIVDAARKAKGPDNQSVPQSSAAREAAEELQKLDPDRYGQLPPEIPSLAG